MSQVTRRELFPGVWLRAVHTNKFKSSYLSVTLMTPLNRETAGANALIPEVLRRGSAVHPDMESLSAALDELYGGAIEPVVRKKGETQCVGFVASFLDDAYALKGEKILEPAAALLGELLLKPYTQDGHFCPDYTAGEKANLIDRIRAQINNKRTYAVQRLTQEMCRYEAFGVDKLGDEASVAAITPESLWAQYQRLLREAQVEVYYCGSAEPDRVAEALKNALAALPVTLFLLAGFERIVAMTLHTALSVLVFAAVRDGRHGLFPLAVLLHALADFFAVVVIRQAGTLASEAVAAAFALLAGLLAVRVYRNLRQNAENT